MLSDKSNAALVIVGHGSTVNPDSSTPTYEHADVIRKQGIFAEVVSCFWKEDPSMREVCRMVESDEIYVVPNFISEGYFTQTVIPRELELEGAITHRHGRKIYYCDPVGSHPRMTDALLKRAAEVAPGIDPATISLLIAGHGTNLNDNSAKAAKDQVHRISALGKYAEVKPVYMEEPPRVEDWYQTEQPHVVMVPFFISDGLHSYQDIPVMLGFETSPGMAASQKEVFRNNPYSLRGKTLFYASAIGTEPMLSEVILDQVVAFDLQHNLSPKV